MASQEDLPGEPQSLWTATVAESDWPSLPPGGVSVDVAVVGGGIVGMTVALLLKRAGRSVAVIEARRIGRQVTGRSTVKVSSQHGMIYGYLVRSFGEELARLYGAANEAALAWIAEQVQSLGMDCEFERRAAVIWCETDAMGRMLEEEAETARRLGLPSSYSRSLELPFATKGGARFDNQAQFHPVKYIDGLAEAFRSADCHIYEQTRVLDVDEGAPCRIQTDRGAVSAAEVVIATNLPILDRGGFFAKAMPKRHACLAARTEGAPSFQDMYISAEEPTRSLRVAVPGGGEAFLVVVGESFKTGYADIRQKLAELEDWTRHRFRIGDVVYHWGNQDYYSVDRVPYVGRLTPVSRHVRVATGFNAWGMTSGTVAAMILADDILGRSNPWAELFHAQRIKPMISGAELVKENVHVAKEWVKDRLVGKTARGAEDLAPGEGAVVRLAGENVAAYRDPAGHLHALSPVCTHMG